MSTEEFDETDTTSFIIDESLDGQRLDKALSVLDENLSRSRLKVLIEDGQVSVNGKVCKSASIKVEVEDEVRVTVPPPVAAEPEPENIPLDIVYTIELNEWNGEQTLQLKILDFNFSQTS